MRLALYVAQSDSAQPDEAPRLSSHFGSLRKVTNFLPKQRRYRGVSTPMYWVTDRLHDGRTVQVPGNQIASIVSTWLAELDAFSPLVEDLANAACVGDWVAARAVGDQLSVDVTVVAA